MHPVAKLSVLSYPKFFTTFCRLLLGPLLLCCFFRVLSLNCSGFVSACQVKNSSDVTSSEEIISKRPEYEECATFTAAVSLAP